MNQERLKKISLSTVKLFVESTMLVYSGNATLFLSSRQRFLSLR